RRESHWGERERLVVVQDLIGAYKNPVIEGTGRQRGTYNYFRGNDPAKWRTDVPAFAEIIYRRIWEGIDLRLFGNGRALEQEFIVRPGADPTQIQIGYRGIERLRIAEDGSLRIQTAFGELHESKPRIYQEIDGQRVEVTGRFKLLDNRRYTFEIDSYEPRHALVIDPTLVYSTYLAGVEFDRPGEGRSIASDASGNAYITGTTSSMDFPTTVGAFQTVFGGGDAFVTKLSADGTTLIYSTLLGGDVPNNIGNAIAVDVVGNAYVTGYSFPGSTFPTTP